MLLNQAFRLLQEKDYNQSIALIEKAQEIVEGVNLLPIEVILKIQYIRYWFIPVKIFFANTV